LPGSKSLNKVIPVKAEELFDMHADFYPGRMIVIEGSAFVNSRVAEISEREILRTAFVKQASFRRSSMCELL
jgi:hypothetical protein